jgi:hypothetical protein
MATASEVLSSHPQLLAHSTSKETTEHHSSNHLTLLLKIALGEK